MKGPPFSLLVVCSAGCASNADVDLNAEITDRGAQISVVVDGYVHGTPQGVPFDDASAVLRIRDQSIALVVTKGTLAANFTLTPPATTDETFQIDVSRDGDTTMLTLQAPAPLELTAPFPAFVPRSQDLSIAWTIPGDDAMGWSIIDSECLVGFVGDVDVGTTQLTIPAAKFVSRDNVEKLTCSSEFDLLRYRLTTGASAGFAETHLSYVRESDAPFASTP